jgi:hypothetical protein
MVRAHLSALTARTFVTWPKATSVNPKADFGDEVRVEVSGLEPPTSTLRR